MFTLAMQAGKIAQRPFIPSLHVSNARQGFFEEPQFRAVLEHLPDYLRPVITFAYCTGWRKACAEAKLPGRLVHDFRRTAVRNRERAGVPHRVAMKLTGHETETIYRRYAIVSPADLNAGVEKLARLHEMLDVKVEAPEVTR